MPAGIEDINDIFQQFLGRVPTGPESSYFSGLMERGEIEPYELSYFMQGMPEYQEKRMATSRQQAMGAAQQYDMAMFPQQREQMMSQFARQGRPDTSGYDMAMGRMQRDIALERGREFSGMEREDQLRMMGYGYQQGTGAQQGLFQEQQATTSYERQLEMQQRQFAQQRQMMQMQQQYMSSQQPSFLEGLAPGLIQGAASIYGGYLGRPQMTSSAYNPTQSNRSVVDNPAYQNLYS